MIDTSRSNIHRRRSTRLQGYDYSQAGAYFLTICTHNRQCLFGEIVGATGRSPTMHINDAGHVVADEWLKTASIRSEIELDEWVVMPNHFHAILVISAMGCCPRADGSFEGTLPLGGNRPVEGKPPAKGDRPVASTGPQPKSVGAVVAGFKSAVTKRINAIRQTPGRPVWQRNYWEHVIRNEWEVNRIRQYVADNPCQWEWDALHPSREEISFSSLTAPTKTAEPGADYGSEFWKT